MNATLPTQLAGLRLEQKQHATRSEDRVARSRTLPPMNGMLARPSVLVLVWLMLKVAWSVAAQAPVSVLDRIGPDSQSTDNNPGGLIVHYAHGVDTEIWGTCGTAWKQPFRGTLAEVQFVLFARVIDGTNGMRLTPVTNLSTFTISLHLWTNGAAGFLTRPEQAHGDLVIPLGPGPEAPELFGTTSVTNRVANSGALYISILPTIRYRTNLAALHIELERDREFVMALAFEGAGTNVVIRQCMVAASGAPDVFAAFNATSGLAAGYSTLAPATPNFATAISAVAAGNIPPVAVTDRFPRSPQGEARVADAALLANDSDPDGDPIALVSVASVSRNGGVIRRSEGWVTYTPPHNDTSTDQFSYTISDGHQETVGTVIVEGDSNPETGNLKIIAAVLETDGGVRLSMVGIPGHDYAVQVTSNLIHPNWSTVAIRKADANGLFGFLVDKPDGASAFYRAASNGSVSMAK